MKLGKDRNGLQPCLLDLPMSTDQATNGEVILAQYFSAVAHVHSTVAQATCRNQGMRASFRSWCFPKASHDRDSTTLISANSSISPITSITARVYEATAE